MTAARWLKRMACAAVLVCARVSGAQAQTAVVPADRAAPPTTVTGLPDLAIKADFTFYGDNTEFFNPFREGETLLGVWGRLFVDAKVGEHATFRAGAFVDRRFVADDVVNLGRPVCALIVEKGASRFIFGTLETDERRGGMGPDLAGPHGLLPPIQIETLAFTRPYEAGLQWTVASPRVSHDSWLSWQRLNTADHREALDAGIAGEARIGGPVSFGYQAHVVHHGGQLFASGAVSDSYVVSPGFVARGRGRVRPSVELYWLKSHDDPDRSIPNGARSGDGGFLRVAVENAVWRAHVIVWRACDFIKQEGDPNYGALREDGTVFSNTRDYSEAGITRLFAATSAMMFEGSFRVHRVESAWNYSYRLLARVNFDVPIRHRP